jgi:small subunit ribosomal protein S17
MADDETPDNQTDQTPAGAAQRDAPAAPVEDAGPVLSAREQRAAHAHRERSQRSSRTPEERDAERRELRRGKAVARRRRRAQEKVKRTQDATVRTGTPPAEPKTSSPQERLGTVISSKPDKTIGVRIDTARRHRRYQKIVRSTSTVHAHDENNEASEGDRVRVVESRPLSRTKRWRLVEVLERAK